MRLFNAFYRSALWQNPFISLLAVVLAALTVLFSAGLLGLSAYLIALTSTHPLLDMITLPVVGVRFFGIGRAVLRYSERIVAHNNVFRFLRDLRVKIYVQLEPILPDYRLQYRPGRFIDQIIADVDNMQAGFLRIIYPFLAAGLVMICGFAWLWGYHSQLAWIFGVVFAGAVFLSPWLQHRWHENQAADALELKQQLYNSSLEISYGKMEILANGRQTEWLEKIAQILTRSRRLSHRNAHQTALENALAVMFPNLAMVMGLIMAGSLFAAGHLSAALLVVVPLVVAALFEAGMPLTNLGSVWDKTLASAARLEEIKTSAPQPSAQSGPEDTVCANGITLEKVSFGYRPERMILENIDLQVEPGRITVVLGPSGAGKSTLMNIILGFITDYTGKIEIKGIDSRTLSPEQRLQYFSAVEQKPFFFNTTVRANMRIANPGASDDEIMTALKKAQIDRFVLNNPRGLDTQLAEMGKNLSGGELQRLALARALLKPADFYLLDEPTAGLDTVNEQEIISFLQELAQSKGVLLITHRQSLLRDLPLEKALIYYLPGI